MAAGSFLIARNHEVNPQVFNFLVFEAGATKAKALEVASKAGMKDALKFLLKDSNPNETVWFNFFPKINKARLVMMA